MGQAEEQLLMENIKYNLAVRRKDDAKYRHGYVHLFKNRKNQFNIFFL